MTCSESTHGSSQPPPEPPIDSGELLQVTVEGLGFGAEGYVMPEPGWFISIPHTLPGDQVTVRVGPWRRKRAWGEVTSWQHHSDAHVAPTCPHYHACSGCALRHLSAERELQWKIDSARQILTRYGPPDADKAPVTSVDAGARSGHRTRGKFRVEQSPRTPGAHTNVTLGLRSVALDGHLVDVRGCPAQSASFRSMMAAFGQRLELDPALAASVAQVELRVSDGQRPAGLALLWLHDAWHDDVDKEALVKLAKDRDIHLGAVHSNKLADVEMLHGEPWWPVHHPDAGPREIVRAPIQSWVHANPGAANALMSWLLNQVLGRGHRAALDLCCATGTVSWTLASHMSHIVAVDEDHLAVAALTDAARRAGMTQITGRPGRVGAVLRKMRREQTQLPRPTLAVINPMRRPLGAKQLRDLAVLGVTQIVYLGPAPVSAAKDAAALASLGYKIQTAAAVNLHPATAQFMLALSMHLDSDART